MRRTAAFAVTVLIAACQRGPMSGIVPVDAHAAREPSLEDARSFYLSQPRYLRPVPYSPTPSGLADLRAATCGLCHTEIYAEWRISTHARAWLDDAQFQEELKKSTQPESDVGWMCVNCHTPMENQLPRLVGALHEGRVERPIYVDNPNHDPVLQLDAITCGTCHVRDGVVLGPWGLNTAPHPVAKSDELLSVEVCTQCHDARAEFEHLALACVFDTGREFADSPYAKEGKTCQSCHMPEIERPAAIGGPPRKTRRHWFGGSLIPKKPEFAGDMEIMAPHFEEGLRVEWSKLPRRVRPRAPTTIRYTLENANAGHLLPTGDPERFIDVIASVRAVDGSTIALSQTRIGAVYEWHPKVRKVSDNRLEPKEQRTFDLTFTPPRSATEVTLHLRGTKWRINEENFRYHELEGRYVANKTFLLTRTRLDVRP